MTDLQAKPRIIWDDRGAHHARMEDCTIFGSREEIALLFGNKADGNPPQNRLTRRIILNPFTAKQLASVLERVMAEYETRFGALAIDVTPTIGSRQRKAADLFESVRQLDVSIGYERSFKMLDQVLLPDRFLLGVSKKEIEYRANERILQICRQMAMPPDLLDIFSPCLLDANYVHFGFEEDGASCIYKVYVEFWDRIRETLKNPAHANRPHLLHLGFKWDPFAPGKKVVTHYTWHPWLTGRQILERIRRIVDPQRYRLLFESAEALVKIASGRMSHRDILYLEVSEAGNPRKSFDINMYRGGLMVGELYPLLAALGQRYTIAHIPFHALYDQVKAKRFGHLSGGINREGKDFCTVYYGVEPIQGSPERLPAAGSGWPRIPENPEAVERTDPRAGFLLERVKALEAPFGMEHSFKVTRGTYQPDRFLVGFQRLAAGPEGQARVLGICRQLRMPDELLARFEAAYASADIVLFGFEKTESGGIYKAYLEFTPQLRQAMAADPKNPAPFTMFTGFKWDGADPSRKVVTRYTCYPAYALRDMAEQAAGFFRREGKAEPIAIVNGILDLAAHRAGPRQFLYFEADEAGSRRSSFSINLYRAGLRLAEVYPVLLAMARYYAISPEAFHRVYHASKTRILGNLAGGIDRQGRDFLTFYHARHGSLRLGTFAS